MMTTTKKKRETAPRSAEELEELASFYDSHDTSGEMEGGQWIDPRPMKTTSLRLPTDVVDALKALAHSRGMRYTALVREIIEQAIHGAWLAESDELVEINERLARIEAAVTRTVNEVPRRPVPDSSPATGERTMVGDETDMSEKDRHVMRNPDGGWDVKKSENSRASAHFSTQREAIGWARKITANTGGRTVIMVAHSLSLLKPA